MPIDHIKKIRALTRHLVSSTEVHLLIIKGPPGWGKSSAVEKVLQDQGCDYVALGSYSTPLNFYGCLAENPSSLIVLDDSSGLFNDSKALALLKSASWASTGSRGTRILKWGSSSALVKDASVLFSGKLIILTNALPRGADTEALISRSIFLELEHDRHETIQILSAAATNTIRFPDRVTIKNVLDFIVRGFDLRDQSRISLRTLAIGYDLARTNPDCWEELFASILPSKIHPKELVKRLQLAGGSVRDQQREFARLTGKSRRTFFNYRRELGLGGASCTGESAD